MNATAIIERDEAQLQMAGQLPAEAAPSTALTPMQMAYQLAARGTDVATIKEMLAIAREMEADHARRAFDSAIAAAKAEIKPILKNKAGHTGRYANFAAIASGIDPIISRFGLSYRFHTQQADRISVTCILSHNEGHSEETTLAGPPDNSGSKNAIQAIGSTLTYLQRYTLIQALGLAVTEDDDGAQASGGPATITEEQAADLLAMIEDIGADNVDGFKAEFLNWVGRERIADIPASKFKACIAALNSRRGK